MAKVSLRAYNQEIEAMIDRGHLDEAIAHCRHIIKTFPKHLETYRLLGKAYLEYKRFPEADDIFTRVLVAVPNDFVANVGMSIIRDEENKLDDAIWHMERAFETQPSNAAIQGELQRLYGRREGIAPPRIRMTRGALAHMYVQGELYPQAISEIKSVLKEDPGRNDMQVLLARAYYRSGLKNDAAEVASGVLRTNPYNLDANRVLVEILGVDHPESVQIYRQRVVELDPYAAQVASSIFLANEVPDAAVTLEHLDWNGQPVGMQPDWQNTRAISLESNARQDEQPDWLQNAFGGETPVATQQTPFDQERSVPAFDAAPPSAKPVEPVDDIPDFLRAAGWGQSTGAFDETQSAFADHEPSPPEEPIEQGDLPDWVKAMAPQQPPATPAEEEEELPDWINKIGTSALPASSESADRPDWIQQLEQPAAQPAEDQPDWVKQFGASEQQASAASEEQPDWLKGFGSEAESTPSAAPGDSDWLDQLSEGESTQARSFESSSSEFDFLNQPLQPTESAPQTPAASDDFDFLRELESQPESASAPSSSDDFDFLNPLGSQPAPAASSADDFDLLNELTTESEQLAPSGPEPAKAGPLGMSEEEQDDSFAWLEGLAAKQGATEGLLTKPEERLEEEPDWIKQAKGVDATIEPPTQPTKPPVAEPAASIEELGKSEQEQDDSFAWLESLAAKQGATEGLLTKPEERLDQEPEWVQQAKSFSDKTQEAPTEEIPAETPSFTEPAASIEELGKSEQERDDSFAWLESLAAKHGATEGLLTRPEERPAEEPEWVKQAKDMGEPLELTPEQPTSSDDTGIWLRSLDEETALSQPQEEDVRADEPLLTTPMAEQPSSVEDTAAWLRGLDEEETPTPQAQERSGEIPDWLTQEKESHAEEPSLTTPAAEQPVSMDETAVWLRGLDEEKLAPPPEEREEKPDWITQNADVPGEELPLTTPVAEQPAIDNTAAWLQSLDEDEIEPVSSKDETAIWFKSLDKVEEPAPQSAEPTPTDDLPAWMQSLEEEQASLEDTTVPAAAEEATQASDWIGSIEAEPEQGAPSTPKVDTGSLPSWLRGLDEEPAERPAFGSQEDLPAWLRDETGEVLAEPTKIEPTRATDWHPLEVEAEQAEIDQPALEPVVPEPVAEQPQPEPVATEQAAPPPQPEPVDVVAIIEEKIVAAEPELEKLAEKTAPPAKPRKEPPARKVTGTLGDPVLGQARSELSRSNISGALESYGRLIRKGRFLEDIVYDLREASYRYPVDVSIWQSLGDAYMRANRLQDALDSYTKAEELLR